jgi:Flp pilus assembly protein TadD
LPVTPAGHIILGLADRSAISSRDTRVNHQKSRGAGAAHAQLVDEGLRHHRAGRLGPAKALYLAALAAQPNDAVALHLLGVVHHQQGSSPEGIELVTRAIAIKPDYPEAHNSLGIALWELGRPAEAEASYREALRLRPDFADAHNNRGAALSDLGRPAEAEARYREALRLQPDFPKAHSNLGNALRELGRLEEAEASFREALRLQPGYPEAHSNLGNVLRDLGRPAQAEMSYREALRLRPDFPDAHNNLGSALRDLGRAAEAEASSREALRLRPGYPDAHRNLGNALRELGRPAEAEASYREALRLRPSYSDAHNNLGAALWDLGRPAEAEASYREALRLRPGFPEAHSNLSNVLLLTGRFEEGWREHEWRWKTRHLSGDAREFAAPLWSGEANGDRVILLHAEQGLGDTLQFCRYVPLIAAGARIILEVQAPLVRLLSTLPGILAIVARGDRLPPFDLQCPLMSLPHAVGTTLDTIPAATPYLTADPASAAGWRDRLAGLDRLRVGLVWAGGRRPDPNLATVDRRRSIALDAMSPLGEIPGVMFISLQKGEPSAQAAHPPRGMALYDFTTDLYDFADTAALVDNLDLVISVDTSVVHLAGALGKPVWLLNRFDTCWRWLLNRDDSPWYPELRQFRQPGPGDWNSVIDRVRDALERLAAGDRDQLRPRRATR